MLAEIRFTHYQRAGGNRWWPINDTAREVEAITAPDAKQVERRHDSVLTRGQRVWLTTGLGLAAFLLANTLYLLGNRFHLLPGGPGERLVDGTYTITELFQVMVLSHTGLGFIAMLVFLVFVIRHLRVVWRWRRRRSVVSGLVLLVAGSVLAGTGPFIMYASASREHAWIWWAHALAAAMVPIGYIVHRTVSFVPPVRGAYLRFSAAVVTVLVAVLAGHGFSNRNLDLTDEAQLAKQKGSFGGPGSKARRIADFVDGPHVAAGFVPPASPFFPSAATTTTGDYLPERIITRGDTSSPERLAPDLDALGFVVKERIGADTCERCHPDTVEQWSASAHRFASFNNPFYEATINDMRGNAVAMTDGVRRHLESFPHLADRTGEIKSKWCSGCHDPSLMLAGQMTGDIDRRSPQAQAGLTCLACHAIDKIHNNTGNGNYNIADEQEDPYLFATAGSGTGAALLHDTAIRAKPDVHRRQMLKPFFRTSEFCAACHKVSLQEPVNNYRWLRGQNEYDAWHDSGVALNASRTFYLPSYERVCQDCHMPLEPAPLGDVAARDGMVRSHRFLAVNTALPYVRGDAATVQRIEEFLQDKKLRVDIFAMHSAGAGERVYALDQTQPTLRSGDRVTFDVVVRNLGVGHTFPGGTNDSNEGWIELTVTDARGRMLAQSGFVGEDGHVDPGAHFFRAVIVDRNGHAIHRRNAQDIYAPVYVNVIGPGAADVGHYEFMVPENLEGDSLTIRARLLWRKFDRTYTEFSYRANPDGFARFDTIPDLPITEIAQAAVDLGVGSSDAEFVANDLSTSTNLDWTRLNDYGIALLLEGNTRAATEAFKRLIDLEPRRVDGYRNLARVARVEGDLAAAFDALRQAEDLAPGDAQTAWVWGQVLTEDGRYDEAAAAYQRVLQTFPQDRAAWRELAIVHYRDHKFDESITAGDALLKIDSEDRIGYYYRMLALRALGRDEEAQRAKAAYEQYQIDESAQEVTKTYRLNHPEDNAESQRVHVHRLELRTGAAAALGSKGVDD